MTQADFKNIFDTYFDAIRNYIYYRSADKELATDIAQDTFMKVWEKQDKLDSNIKGLLYKIANDLFISKYRRQSLERDYSNSLQFDSGDTNTEQSIHYNELKTNYERALSKLPEKQRVVFLMSRNEELKYHEIAERLKISVKAVEKRMKNALAYLRTEIKV